MRAHQIVLAAAAGRVGRIPRSIAPAIAVRHAHLCHGANTVAADILAAGAGGIAGPIVAGVIDIGIEIGHAVRLAPGQNLMAIGVRGCLNVPPIIIHRIRKIPEAIDDFALLVQIGYLGDIVSKACKLERITV